MRRCVLSSTLRKSQSDVIALTLTLEDPVREAPLTPINIAELKRLHKDMTAPGRRVAPRYELEMEVIILTQTRSFRTTTVNVSASGALLKDPLPQEFMSCASLEFIFIQIRHDQKQRLMFRGRAVGGPNSTARITFIESAGDSQKVLQSSFKALSPIGSKTG